MLPLAFIEHGNVCTRLGNGRRQLFLVETFEPHILLEKLLVICMHLVKLFFILSCQLLLLCAVRQYIVIEMCLYLVTKFVHAIGGDTILFLDDFKEVV